LESKQDFKQSTQSINNDLYNKNVLKNDKSQTLTIDHLGDSGRLSLKQNNNNNNNNSLYNKTKSNIVKNKDQDIDNLSNL